MTTPDPKVNPHESHRVYDHERRRIVVLPPPSSERIAWTGSTR